jgi:leucyl-tRNA---protein transferase
METVVRWTEPPRRCHYGPDHICACEYLCVGALSSDEYMAYLLAGWRRFGHTVFRQSCSGRNACRSLRVDVAGFLPDRSQRRTRKANDGMVHLRIGTPAVTPEKVALFDRFHADRSETRGWQSYESDDAQEYARIFVLNPFPTQEWCYFLDDVLVGVGYVDHLVGGLSAIYFAHDPRHRDRSLGTWNVLNLIDRARALGLPHVYLGYVCEGCLSLQYKARFRPHQCLDADRTWRNTDDVNMTIETQ